MEKTLVTLDLTSYKPETIKQIKEKKFWVYPKKDPTGTLTDSQIRRYIKKNGVHMIRILLNEPQAFQASFATGFYNIIQSECPEMIEEII